MQKTPSSHVSSPCDSGQESGRGANVSMAASKGTVILFLSRVRVTYGALKKMQAPQLCPQSAEAESPGRGLGPLVQIAQQVVMRNYQS